MIHLLLRTPATQTCVHCAHRRVREGYQTCGDSYCQEADYHANAARAAKGRRLKELHRRLQREAEEKAGQRV